jgi:hypothetical protein
MTATVLGNEIQLREDAPATCGLNCFSGNSGSINQLNTAGTDALTDFT